MREYYYISFYKEISNIFFFDEKKRNKFGEFKKKFEEILRIPKSFLEFFFRKDWKLNEKKIQLNMNCLWENINGGYIRGNKKGIKFIYWERERGVSSSLYTRNWDLHHHSPFSVL